VQTIMRSLEREADCEAVDDQDGLKLLWTDRWVHLRGSNTEPVLRVIAEARTQKQARALADQYSDFVARQMQALG
jgi:phosphomannomutase